MDAVSAWHSLVTAYGRLSAQMTEVLQRQHQVNLAEFEALLRIDLAEGGTVQAVALTEQLLLTQSGVTRLLARLEQAGLITRTVAANDGRRKDIALTERGQLAVQEMRAAHRAHIDSLIGAKLSEHEIQALVGLLDKITPA